MKPGLELGTQVRYSRVLRRDSLRPLAGGRGDYKAWLPYPVDGEYGNPDKERIGIIYGLRTYTNGLTVWGFGDEPTTYKWRESLAVALVAWDARRKPDAVLIDDLTILEKM